MPTRKVPGKPMEKWCRECEQFKPNPGRLVNPMYCPDCRKARWIAGLKKRKKYYENVKKKK